MAHVEVNKRAPARGDAEIFIKAPIETVWHVLSDFEAWPRWNKSISRIKLEGPINPGTTFVWMAGGSKIISRLEEVDAPKTLAWTGRTLGIRAVHTWRLDEAADGTRVYTEESFEGFVVRLFPGLMSKILAKALNQGVTALKSEAEARHAHVGPSQSIEIKG